MTNSSRLLFYVALTVSVAGCSGMVPMYEFDKSHAIDRSLTKLDISEGILQGAQAAGWKAEILPNGRILATYIIRTHTVHVEIFYTHDYYKLTYRSSNGMKVFCTEQDRLEARNIKISGRQYCPGNGAPMYIHGKYKQWVDSLNVGIQKSLASI